MNCRSMAHYPIDESIFGLTEEQQSVSSSNPDQHVVSLYLVRQGRLGANANIVQVLMLKKTVPRAGAFSENSTMGYGREVKVVELIYFLERLKPVISVKLPI